MERVEYKYPADIVQQTRDYISSCTNEQMELPTVEGLALKLDVDDDTLVEWAKIHNDFADVFYKLKMSQKKELVNGGMYGGKEINVAMAIFLLKANHGLIETSRTELTGKDGKNLLVCPPELYEREISRGTEPNSQEPKTV